MTYINKPRLVLLLLKIAEIINRTNIKRKLMPAIIVPMIVSQFFEDGGSLILTGFMI